MNLTTIIKKPYDSENFRCLCESTMHPTTIQGHKSMIHVACKVCKLTAFFYQGNVFFVSKKGL